MAVRDQITPEQWKQLFNGPFAAAAFAATAGGGAFELIKEMFAASRFLNETFQSEQASDYGPIVRELLEAMKGMSREDAGAMTVNYEGRDPETLRSEVGEAVRLAGEVASGLDGAEGYRRWVIDAARAAVQSSRGGFMGIGASKDAVDLDEKIALDTIASLLVGTTV